VGIGANEPDHDRHPCFHIDSAEGLNELRTKIWEHHVKGGASAPLAADKPGESDSGSLLLCLVPDMKMANFLNRT
jgi:hypothetical protein